MLITLDIKPNNILIDPETWKVKLSDLENAVHLPPRMGVKKTETGNQLWCSPEAHAKGTLTWSTDIFSFGIVVSRPFSPFRRIYELPCPNKSPSRLKFYMFARDFKYIEAASFKSIQH
jgi:serine/threonine protein kinase